MLIIEQHIMTGANVVNVVNGEGNPPSSCVTSDKPQWCTCKQMTKNPQERSYCKRNAFPRRSNAKMEAQFHCKCNSYSKEQKYWAQNTTQARALPEARNSPIFTSGQKSLSWLQKIHGCIEQANSTLPRRLLKLPKPWESIVTEFDEYVSVYKAPHNQTIVFFNFPLTSIAWETWSRAR